MKTPIDYEKIKKNHPICCNSLSVRFLSADGAVVKKPDTKVEQTVQEVCLNGEKVGYESFGYYMLNKPAGVISATEDRSCQTVVDLIKEKKRKDLFPVGRLDKDTEGLPILTPFSKLLTSSSVTLPDTRAK